MDHSLFMYGRGGWQDSLQTTTKCFYPSSQQNKNIMTSTAHHAQKYSPPPPYTHWPPLPSTTYALTVKTIILKEVFCNILKYQI